MVVQHVLAELRCGNRMFAAFTWYVSIPVAERRALGSKNRVQQGKESKKGKFDTLMVRHGHNV